MIELTLTTLLPQSLNFSNPSRSAVTIASPTLTSFAGDSERICISGFEIVSSCPSEDDVGVDGIGFGSVGVARSSAGSSSSLMNETYVCKNPFGLNFGRQIGSHDEVSGVDERDEDDSVFRRRWRSGKTMV